MKNENCLCYFDPEQPDRELQVWWDEQDQCWYWRPGEDNDPKKAWTWAEALDCGRSVFSERSRACMEVVHLLTGEPTCLYWDIHNTLFYCDPRKPDQWRVCTQQWLVSAFHKEALYYLSENLSFPVAARELLHAAWRKRVTLEQEPLTEIEIHVLRELTQAELFVFAKRYCQRYPGVVRRILDLLDAGKLVSCPFPHQCAKFPCESLSCNADSLDNGFPYRMS